MEGLSSLIRQLERFLRITIDQGFPGREKTHPCHRVIGAKSLPGNGFRYKVTGTRRPMGIRAGAQHVMRTAI